ncbi:MAG: hypothetical protein RLZZ70_763 [Candidatus Parcubacteria bacterium]
MKPWLYFAALPILGMGGVLFVAPEVLPIKYSASDNTILVHDTEATSTRAEVVDNRPIIKHVPQPTAIKAIYMSACVAGTPSFRDDLVKVVQETEINSILIDIKDYSGTISFPPSSGSQWSSAWEKATCGARDMREFIASLHEAGIYVIGRISVFQDPVTASERPHLAVKRADGVTNWKDGKGLSFIDVAASEHWDHIIALARESYNIGFDELNFDYVRYPSDGNMQDISFPHTIAGQWPNNKAANLEAFFTYLHTELSKPEQFATVAHANTGRTDAVPYTSADLFGMTTTNTDDLSIGQVLERAVPYFDVIAPMVYPSHYPNNYLDLGDPNDVPYQIVYHAMRSGADRLLATTTTIAGFLHTQIGTSTPTRYQKASYPPSKLRTWIQDFDYGGDYDAADVRAQIDASYAAGVDSWMVWAPSNRYTKAAFLSE